MDKEERMKKLRTMFGMNKRTHIVRCKRCGKELLSPAMYSEKEREVLQPYCCTATVLTVQWLIGHGWHVTTYDADPPGAYYCPDCFPQGQPEYSRRPYCDDWCRQAEQWMNENNGER